MTLTLDLVSANVWFGGALLREGDWTVVQDAKGSVRWRQNVSTSAIEKADYYPFGQEKPSTTAQGREKFATYLRDDTGLDYADQRYYSSAIGRFMTADPYKASGGVEDPGSWNRYSYTRGDPVNRSDPWGLQDCGNPCNVTAPYPDLPAPTRGGGFTNPHLPLPDCGPDCGMEPEYRTPLDLKGEAGALRNLVNQGKMGDCEALNQFAVLVATEVGRPDAFVASFGAYIPESALHGLSFGASILGISYTAGTEANVLLNNGTHAGTFGSPYNDAGFKGESVDQAHHFAFYFQLGYTQGALEGELLARLQDGLKGNIADVNLAIKAADMGQYLKMAGASGISSVLENLKSLCK